METKKININTKIDLMLFIIFLMLRLDGVINWKWLWVFSPLWIMWCIQVCILIVVVIANWQPKNLYRAPSGDPLVWDAKTNTLYGPWSAEDS